MSADLPAERPPSAEARSAAGPRTFGEVPGPRGPPIGGEDHKDRPGPCPYASQELDILKCKIQQQEKHW